MGGWDITKYAVEIELLEPMLGTIPAQKSIWAEHIATQQAKAMKREGKTDAEIEAELEATLLDYGQYEGMGQWRGSGHGAFEVVKFAAL